MNQDGATWFVYILRCADGTLYTGITTDLARRCSEHNGGKGARYTRARRPVIMVYHETCVDRSAALRREWKIRTLARRDKADLVLAASSE